MIYNKKEENGQTIHTAKYSKQGDFVVIRNGVMERLDYNPHTKYLVNTSIFGAYPDEGRYAIFVATATGYKQLGPNLKSRADAIKIAKFVSSTQGEAHVIDTAVKAFTKTQEEDPEEYDLR